MPPEGVILSFQLPHIETQVGLESIHLESEKKFFEHRTTRIYKEDFGILLQPLYAKNQSKSEQKTIHWFIKVIELITKHKQNENLLQDFKSWTIVYNFKQT